jgi:hypothetical protein
MGGEVGFSSPSPLSFPPPSFFSFSLTFSFCFSFKFSFSFSLLHGAYRLPVWCHQTSSSEMLLTLPISDSIQVTTDGLHLKLCLSQLARKNSLISLSTPGNTLSFY